MRPQQSMAMLQRAGIAAADIDRYLGVVTRRVESAKTGSQWLLHSLASMHGSDTKDAIVTALTAATVQRQFQGKPVHEWTPAKIEEGRTAAVKDLRIEEFMTTDLFTVHPEEPIALVVNLMDWKHIRHVPVEDDSGRVIGVVSWFDVVHHYARREDLGHDGERAAAPLVICIGGMHGTRRRFRRAACTDRVERGLYFLTFNSGLSEDQQQLSNRAGAEHATSWVGKTYLVVK
jgi:CBS domain-containing protein